MGRSTKEIIWKQCSGTNEPAGLLSFRNPRDAQSIFSEASSPLRSLCHRTFSSCHFFPEPIILQEQAWFISGPRKQVILFLSPSKPEHIPPWKTEMQKVYSFLFQNEAHGEKTNAV